MKFRQLFLLVLLLFTFPVSISHAVSANDAYQSGLAYYKNGQWELSILQFKTAVLLDARSWLAYQMMSYAFVQQANAPEAMDACMKSLKISPNNPTLWNFVETTIKPHLYPSNNGEPSSTPPLSSLPARDSVYVNLGGVAPLSVYLTSQTSAGLAFGIGYGFAVDKSFSLLLDARFSSLPQYNTYNLIYGPGYLGYASVSQVPILTFLGNAKCNIVNGDNPVVFYAILGLGPTFYFRGYSGTYLAFRCGLGLDIRLNPDLALTYEMNVIAPTLNDVYSLSSLGLKFNR